MQNLIKLIKILTPYERKRGVVLICMSIINALLDMLGVASVMPFIAVLANPELVETNIVLNTAYNQLKFTDTKQFLFALGLVFFVLLVLSLIFKALNTYAQLNFSKMSEFSFGKRLVEGYLYQSYSWFLGRHSADLGKTILSEVNNVINFALTPMMTLITQGIIALSLMTLIFIIDPILALAVGFTLSIAYALIYRVTRVFINRIGTESVNANQWRFTAVSEAFGAVKEIKVGGLEDVYIKRFAESAQIYATNQASVEVITQLPRFGLEAITFGGLLLVILYLMAESGSFTDALPIIALYVFAGYRLMPALQQVYGAITQLRFTSPALDALYVEMGSLKKANHNQEEGVLSLQKTVTLNNVRYSYPNSSKSALKNINLTIPARTTVGFVGATGGGKTTIVDLILGLIEAKEGTLEVDGNIISRNNRNAWRQTIGYVPQQIFLVDDSIIANIAFGVNPKNIDLATIERVAKIANIHDFIKKELPEQYQTTVGERGVRLSGGQRQRIGIARALYHNPQLLILDEATSALDNVTEQEVMKAIHNLGNEITIIIVAHRLSTIKECDCIFLLEKGELKGQGNFEELINSDVKFREMAINS